jgi:hypothetical protein
MSGLLALRKDFMLQRATRYLILLPVSFFQFLLLARFRKNTFNYEDNFAGTVLLQLILFAAFDYQHSSGLNAQPRYTKIFIQETGLKTRL